MITKAVAFQKAAMTTYDNTLVTLAQPLAAHKASGRSLKEITVQQHCGFPNHPKVTPMNSLYNSFHSSAAQLKICFQPQVHTMAATRGTFQNLPPKSSGLPY